MKRLTRASIVLLSVLALSGAGCRNGASGCPVAEAELVADADACVTVAVTRDSMTQDAQVTCGSATVRGMVVDVHFPSDGTWGYGIAPGPGATERYGVIETSGTMCGSCNGTGAGTGLGIGGQVLVPFEAGDRLRLVLDASVMGTETWTVAVCPEGMRSGL